LRRFGILKVAVVGDRGSYPLQLTNSLNQQGVHTIFYGPKRPPFGAAKRKVVFTGFLNYRPTWTSWGYFTQIPIQASRDRPDVIHFDFTLTIFGSSYLSTLPLAILVPLLRFMGFKVVITIHDIVTRASLVTILRGRTIFSLRILLLAFYSFLGLANAIIVHFDSQRRQLTEEFGISPNKVSVVPFGVEAYSPPDPVREASWKKRFWTDEIVLFLGTIGPRKGIEYLIRGFSIISESFPNAKLVVGGPTDEKYALYTDRLLKEATGLPEGSFEYLGYLEAADAHTVLDSSSVVVLPYLYSYASPSMLYWVIQHQKPVIASNIGTLSEELSGYPRELLVQPQDPHGIADALASLFNSNSLEQRCIEFAKRKANENSWKDSAARIVAIYSEILKVRW
jgi:glycosyltransferase involved in cell wall biosynthesis